MSSVLLFSRALLSRKDVSIFALAILVRTRLSHLPVRYSIECQTPLTSFFQTSLNRRQFARSRNRKLRDQCSSSDEERQQIVTQPVLPVHSYVVIVHFEDRRRRQQNPGAFVVFFFECTSPCAQWRVRCIPMSIIGHGPPSQPGPG